MIGGSETELLLDLASFDTTGSSFDAEMEIVLRPLESRKMSLNLRDVDAEIASILEAEREEKATALQKRTSALAIAPLPISLNESEMTTPGNPGVPLPVQRRLSTASTASNTSKLSMRSRASQQQLGRSQPQSPQMSKMGKSMSAFSAFWRKPSMTSSMPPAGGIVTDPRSTISMLRQRSQLSRMSRDSLFSTSTTPTLESDEFPTPSLPSSDMVSPLTHKRSTMLTAPKIDLDIGSGSSLLNELSF